jgi:hypothetical protein
VRGLAADGVTRVLWRRPVPASGQVTFSVENENGDPGLPESGTLSALGANRYDTSLTVDTTDVNGQYFAFALLKAPVDFCRHIADDTATCRQITLCAQLLPAGDSYR